MSATDADPGAGYWYPVSASEGLRPVDVLNAFRRYREAEAGMRKRVRQSMGMGETDVMALRHLLGAQRDGGFLNARKLGHRLGISSASVTVLVDRLARSGHVERRRNPADRRSIIIVATPASDEKVRDTLGAMHEAMFEAAEALSPERALAVHDFMDRMREAVELVGTASPVDASAAAALGATAEAPPAQMPRLVSAEPIVTVRTDAETSVAVSVDAAVSAPGSEATGIGVALSTGSASEPALTDGAAPAAQAHADGPAGSGAHSDTEARDPAEPAL